MASQKPQSKLSLWHCKVTGQPNDIAIQHELTEWSRHGTKYLAHKVDTAFSTHFKSKMNRGMEMNLSYKPEPSSPIKAPLSRILKNLDASAEGGTLRNTLDDVDTKISRWENARSGSHGYAARAYEQSEELRFPLDWEKVKELRVRAVRVTEAMVDAGNRAEAEASQQSAGYGSVA